MEWKEHIAWIAPILLTGVAYVIMRYGLQLARDRQMKNAIIALFTAAFLVAGVAGLLGALITRAAPVV